MPKHALQKLISYISIILIVISTTGWAICMSLPFGWHIRKTVIYTFDIGLWRVTLGIGLVGDAASLAMQKLGFNDKLMDDFRFLKDGFQCSIFDIQSRMCISLMPTIAGDFCGIFTQLRISSIVMMILIPFGLICHILGACFLYYYWNVKAKAITRKWIMFFLLIAPLLYSIGEIQYAFLTMGLSDFPPRDNDTTWGGCLIFTMMCTVIAWVPFLLSGLIAKRSPTEAVEEALKDLKEARLDAAIEMRGYNQETHAGGGYDQQYGGAYDQQYGQQYGGAYAPQQVPSWGAIPFGEQSPQPSSGGYHTGPFQQQQMQAHDPWRQPYS